MIVKNILQFIDYKGINKSVFYKKTGLSNGFLDKVKDIGSSKIEQILKSYPEINLEWLITGKGHMLKNNKNGVSEESSEYTVNQKDSDIQYLKDIISAKDSVISSQAITIDTQAIAINLMKSQIRTLKKEAKEMNILLNKKINEFENKQNGEITKIV